MLRHPWLDMPANYDIRYTKKEFEIMQLKKDLKGDKSKNGADTAADLMVDDPRQEMNELIESDPEMYQPASEDD